MKQLNYRIYDTPEDIGEILAVVTDPEDFDKLKDYLSDNKYLLVLCSKSNVDERFYFLYKHGELIMLLQADDQVSYVAYMEKLISDKESTIDALGEKGYDQICKSYKNMMNSISEYLINKNQSN